MLRANFCIAPLLALALGSCATPADPECAGEDCVASRPAALRLSTAAVHLDATAEPQRVSLQALRQKGGEVTRAATWTLSDPSIGTIDNGVLTVRGGLPGGTYTITASHQDETATALLILSGSVTVVDPSAPTDAKTYFGGAAGGTAPTVAYPINNSLLPPNLLQMKLQWRRDLGQQVFRIRVRSVAYKAELYVGGSLCSGDQCTYAVPDATWRQIGRSLAGQQATLVVAGVASKGAAIGTSAASALTFSPEDLAGGVYYFATASRGIKRVPFGAKKAIDFVANGAETGCAGCHAVSRDGKQVAIEFGSGATNVGSTVVSGNRASVRNFALTPTIAWNFAWFNPAGDQLIANWQGQLSVRAASDGHVLSTVAAAQYGVGATGGAMPEWSPDGKWIAFVRLHGTSPYDFELIDDGDIAIMPYNGGAFGPAVALVAGQKGIENHFFPTWSPDSKWLVFNTQTCSGLNCQQYDAVNTRLRMVRAVKDDGTAAVGPTPIELLEGTHIKNKTNNWPKFAPFYQAGRFGFVIYSAQYGVGFDPGGTSQMYMIGLDMEKAKAGTDPSYRPVYLPFQDRATGNHSAIWTTDVRCQDATDCPSGYTCTLNVCAPLL
jgi:hypothetical protein